MKLKILNGIGDFFALDIGTAAIRALQLADTARPPAKGWTLQAYGYAGIDPTITLDNSDEGKRKLQEAIQGVVQQAGITTKNVVVNLPANKVYAAIIDVPNRPKVELEKVIKYKLDKYIPVALDSAKVDWTYLGVSPIDANNQEVLISSANKEYVEERMQILEDIGFDVVAEEPDSIAIARALTPNGVLDAIMLIDFGETATDIVVVFQGMPRLVRSVPGGLQGLTVQVAQNLNVRPDQARQFILKFGLAQDKLDGQVFKVLDSVLGGFIGELQKSIQFFQARYVGNLVKGLVPAGFASVIPYLSEYLEAKLAIAAQRGNPWQNVMVPQTMQPQLSSVANEFAVAVGLAERSNTNV